MWVKQVLFRHSFPAQGLQDLGTVPFATHRGGHGFCRNADASAKLRHAQASIVQNGSNDVPVLKAAESASAAVHKSSSSLRLRFRATFISRGRRSVVVELSVFLRHQARPSARVGNAKRLHVAGGSAEGSRAKMEGGAMCRREPTICPAWTC